MIYARVHDQTVADDYYAAMSQVEKRLELIGLLEMECFSLDEKERNQLLGLTEELIDPLVTAERRTDVVIQMRQLLIRLKPVHNYTPPDPKNHFPGIVPEYLEEVLPEAK